ncbi:MAG: SDR family oxidoreductase [Actinobacteria bacterium]|nr:SDR family oxidoreductase [Actinomycetota bacterium]
MVLVTGAAFGLGRATCDVFHERGYRVVAADIDAGLVAETAERINADGGEAVHVVTDVTDPEQVEAMVQLAGKEFGRLDAAVNNAAVPQAVSYDEPDSTFVHELAIDEWKRVIDIDLNGVFYCLRSELAFLRKQGEGGAIVNLSSGAALLALEAMVAYNAAKKAVFSLTETAALENGPYGIRVNTVVPGNMSGTKMFLEVWSDRDPKDQSVLNEHSPLKRTSKPAEIAEAIYWLCSERASYVTGVTLTADGGGSIRHVKSHVS